MTTNADLLKRRLNAVPRGVNTAHPASFVVRADGAEMWDVEGKRYIDFVGGIGVQNTGHRHPKIVAAIKAQVDKAIHTSFQVNPYESYIALAEALNARAPIDGPAKTIFLSTGAEAVENACKIARYATKRPGIIAFTGGFHGRTMLTMAMTGKALPYKHRFGPMPGEVFHAPFPIAHYGVSVEDSLRALEFIFRADVEASRVAAITLEPVQGEGGFHPAPPEFMRALRELCDRHGILLIVDEVQAGFARTGRMFGVQHSGVKPDLITVAKALAGGFPLSGVVGRAEVMDAAEPGGLGGTYAGSPVACAAALAVLDVIEEENLLARAEALGQRTRERLAALASRNDLAPIAGVRGLGSMVAFDLVTARGGREPDAASARRVTAKALDGGLILLSCGVHGETIRLLYPLTIPDPQLDEGLDLLEHALRLD